MTATGEPGPTVVIIGAGRAGRALALALTRAHVAVHVCTRRPAAGSPTIAGLAGTGTIDGLIPGIACSVEPWTEALERADIVLLAVPDDAIPDVASRLRDAPLSRAVVLHCSGLRDRTALAALEGRTRGLGSFHPLQTLAGDSEAAGRLRAAFAVLEGDTAAVKAGRELATRLGMRALEIESARKPLYHAAAVMISNYTVALAAVGERLAIEAGVPAESAGRIFLPLLEGTLHNLETLGTTTALTGPIQRGDVGSVRAHLAALDPGTARLYSVLGLEALEVARRAGLRDDRARAIEEELLRTVR